MLWQFEDSTCPTISPVAICRANQRRPAFIRHTCPTKQKVIPAFPKKNFNLNPVLRTRILPDSSLSDLIQIFFFYQNRILTFLSLSVPTFIRQVPVRIILPYPDTTTGLYRTLQYNIKKVLSIRALKLLFCLKQCFGSGSRR